MRWISVGAASLNQTPLDWKGNCERILAAMAKAREENTDLLLTPELSISGYGCEDAFFGTSMIEQVEKSLKKIRADSHEMVVVVGLPIRYEDSLFNAACMIVDGKILGVTAKQYLAGDGVHYEPRWFKPWPEGRHVQITLAEERVPFGDILFQLGDIRIAFEICEDAWIGRRRSTTYSDKNVDVILNPSASHFSFGKQLVRERIVREASRANAVGYVYSNFLGNESGRIIYDGGSIIASQGEIVAVGKRFSFRPWHITTACIDVDSVRLIRERDHNHIVPLKDIEGLVCSRFKLKNVNPRPLNKFVEIEMCKEEEFTRAVALGLFDYARKSRSKGFVVSLSGGADSAATAVLVAMAWHLAITELGLEELQSIFSVEMLSFKGFLFCIYQSTRNSSDNTRRSAQEIAESLGATFLCWDIEGISSDYCELVEKNFGRKLDWKKDDITLQNIQARTRAPGIWMVANLMNCLLLATSNRSEAAVGYTTMDGDTCGGLSPIAGIDKAFLLRWLHWMENIGLPELGPIHALSCVNEQTPTAELRPIELNQTDEKDLMPYDVLDAIERYAIRDKRSPKDCLLLLNNEFPNHSNEDIAGWVCRFFKLWAQNQWKRERYAPSFHLDDKNLDPKTWCRFPILSGGFEEELENLL